MAKFEDVFTMSAGGSHEYCCSLVRVSQVHDIPNSDAIGFIEL